MKKTLLMSLIVIVEILFIGPQAKAEGNAEIGMGILFSPNSLYSQEKANNLPLISLGYWTDAGSKLSVGLRVNIFHSGTIEGTNDITGSFEFLAVKYFPTKRKNFYFALIPGGTLGISDQVSKFFLGHEVGIKLFAMRDCEYDYEMRSLWLVGGFKKKAAYISFMIN